MKNILTIIVLSLAIGLASCGPNAEQQAKEQAAKDSLRLDSITKAKAEAIEQAYIDSIAAADTIVIMESIPENLE